MNRRTLLIILVVLIVVAMACMACVALLGGSAFLIARSVSEVQSEPFIPVAPDEPASTPEIVRSPELASSETLDLLADTLIPENDPVELAARLLGIHDAPAVDPAPNYQVGDREDFWLIDTGADETFQTEAILEYQNDVVSFWVEDGVTFDMDDLVALADTFAEDIYPLNRAFFGSEWTPGIDNDPHVYILYATNVGFGTAGYFSSGDELPPQIAPYSNSAEMFVINADNTFLYEEYAYGVLAHEFQHMIHWYQDRNEASWMNEGLSELASLLNGYHYGGFASLYTSNPDIQLTDWPVDQNATTPHYGAGLLFTTYFLERFGDEATQALVAHDQNSLDGVQAVLTELDLRDPETGAPIRADDVVLDWMIANYLADPDVQAGRYAYNRYPFVLSQALPTETITDCSPGERTRDVHQFGADYIRFACDHNGTLRFEGSTQVDLLPQDAFSGDYAFWSNTDDESDTTLTRGFDFSAVSGPLTLSYWTWYDIEEDWDYVYLEVSTNGGVDWDILQTPSSTSTDPNGNNYGSGYTGSSGDWIQERVDLSAYAGQDVLLRFEYVTDANVHGDGLLLDDVSIDEIGYFTDFEDGADGWEAAGFARVDNVLPQTFRIAVLYHGNQNRVEILDVPANNDVDIELDFSGDVESITLLVTGTTPFTRTEAGYRFNFLP